MSSISDALWVEKYRPKTLDECVLQDSLRESFKGIVTSNNLPNSLFTGGPGVGKTTVARALCNELGYDYLFVNASENGGIDTLRNQIRQYASSVAITGDKKVVILDEADSLTAAFQPALRGFMEEFSANCRFILTCNYKNRIIEPLHSRCAVFDFSIPKANRPVMASQIFKRLKFILKSESVLVESDEVLTKLIIRYFPDYRRIINESQRYSSRSSGNRVIDAGILNAVSSASELNTDLLVSAMRTKNFFKMQEWAVNALSVYEPQEIYRKIYDASKEKKLFSPQSIPDSIVILAEYGYRSAFVADQEVNLVAALVELLTKCDIATE